MATILVVDDGAANREFLATLLGYRQHRVLQACDGRAALASARALRPELIISDILMPTMDGYELVRQIRADGAIARTLVIFTTAHYLDREAHALAEACGVSHIIPKPCEPDAVLRTVDAVLSHAVQPTAAPDDRFDREHLRLVTDKLREKTEELHTVHAKLTALIEVSQQLALERDPQRLFTEFTRAARQIIGARYAVVARADPGADRPPELFASGLEHLPDGVDARGPAAEVLASLLAAPGTYRTRVPAGAPRLEGLPRGHPAVRSLLASSIVSLTRVYGWVCVTEKIGFEAFSPDDERILAILGAQLGRIYENGRLYLDLKLRTTELEESERRFRSLLANASDLVMVTDAQGVIQYASPSHERVLGRRPADLVGSDAFEFLHPHDSVSVRKAFAATVAGRARDMRVEYRGRCADGSWRVLEGIGTNLLDDSCVRGIVMNAWDVTHRQHAEQRTAALLEVAQELAGSVDLERMLDRVQRRASAMLPCDAVGTFALNEAGTAFRLMAQRGMWDEVLSVAANGDLPCDTAFGHLASRAETAVINDFAEVPGAARRLARRCGVGAVIVASLRVHDRQLGTVVAIRTLERPPFTSDEVELFTGIAKQLAVALEARELDRLQQEEAAVSRGLARAGRELISALGDPGLLERLCQITIEVLGCDVSATLLRQADNSWTPVATAGWSAEDREAVLAAAVPNAAMAVLLPPLGRGELVTLRLGEETMRVPVRRRVESLLCVALMHAGRVIGVHTAGYARRVPEPTAVQRRIAEGLGNLASLALDNVRLIERLDRANRLKSDFVGTMSHELRTPLNVIMGFDELLSSGEFGPLNAEQLDAVARIEAQAARLLELVNATLDVSRLESGRTPLELSDVTIGELLDEIRGELRHPAQANAVAVQWPVPAPRLRLYTDRAKLKVVLKNLLDNALKFTPAGRVLVGARATAGGVELTVADTGIGIAPESFETIFESFRQLEPSMTRRYGGVGLGLYLARRLTEMLGGTIGVSSELGHGSTFRVVLPVAPAPAAPAVRR